MESIGYRSWSSNRWNDTRVPAGKLSTPAASRRKNGRRSESAANEIGRLERMKKQRLSRFIDGLSHGARPRDCAISHLIHSPVSRDRAWIDLVCKSAYVGYYTERRISLNSHLSSHQLLPVGTHRLERNRSSLGLDEPPCASFLIPRCVSSFFHAETRLDPRAT